MKKLTVIGIVVALVFGGCTLFPTVTFDDAKGEWDFPDTTFNNSPITSIHLSVMGENQAACRIDLSWNNFDNFYYGDGTMNGNVFTGEYNVGGNSPDTTTYSITVTFSLSGSTLKAVFNGQGPLNGLILEHGVKAAT
jgi:hypothetical protein